MALSTHRGQRSTRRLNWISLSTSFLLSTRPDTVHLPQVLPAAAVYPKNLSSGAAPDAAIAVVKLKSAKQYFKRYYDSYLTEFPAIRKMTLYLVCIIWISLQNGWICLLYTVSRSEQAAAGGLGDRPLPLVLNGYGSLANRIPVIGTGNEADKRHHFYNEIPDQQTSQTVEIRVGERVTGFTMELWTSSSQYLIDRTDFPSPGETTTRIPIRVNSRTDFEFVYERTKVTIDYRLIVEEESAQLIFFRFDQPSPGIWKSKWNRYASSTADTASSASCFRNF